MSKAKLIFGDIEVKKSISHKSKHPFDIGEVDIKKLISNKILYGKGFKKFIGYANYEKIKLLCIMLSKIGGYAKYFEETKCMDFLIEDEELLEAYNKMWQSIRTLMKKEFGNRHLYDEKCLKTKIKSYDGKVNTYFHGNKTAKEGVHCACLSVTLIDSIFKIR